MKQVVWSEDMLIGSDDFGAWLQDNRSEELNGEKIFQALQLYKYHLLSETIEKMEELEARAYVLYIHTTRWNGPSDFTLTAGTGEVLANYIRFLNTDHVNEIYIENGTLHVYYVHHDGIRHVVVRQMKEGLDYRDFVTVLTVSTEKLRYFYEHTKAFL